MIKVFLMCLLCLPLLVIDPPVFAFVMISMFPAFTSMMVDRNKDKRSTILFLNLTGLVRYLVPMLERLGSNKFTDALSITKLFMVYTFAALGYLVAWLVPRLFVIYADYKNQNRARIISGKLAKIVEEWGPEVRR